MLGWNQWANNMRRRRTPDCRTGSLDTEETAVSRKMRALAVEFKADGRGRLCMPARWIREMRECAERADQLKASCMDGGVALESLRQGVRLMEACAVQASAEAVRDLPSSGGKTRILTVAEALVGSGDRRLNKENIMLALASFDDVQALEMAELWAVPEAVRICLVRAYCNAAGIALEIAAERGRAERWVGSGNDRPGRMTPAFAERALNLLSEHEEGAVRPALELCIQKTWESAEQAVQAAHGCEAVARMRLENLLHGKRLLDALDWAECFEQLSAVEAELRYDPLGTYPDMEEDSRAAVRIQTAKIARKLGVGELTVARHAVSAAQAARYEGAPERRQTVCYWLYDDEGRAGLLKRMGMERHALPAMIPDPSGVRSAWGIIVLFAGIYLVFQAAVRSIWLIFPGIPVAWCGATALLGRSFPRLVKPYRLLKMEINRVPERLSTLVVMPALLSSRERAADICDQMEALGCLERDENIAMLILGDYADGDAEHAPGDREIVEFVRERIRDMNARAGGERYFYLHRNRRLLEADGRWMGRDRKRGALMDLNRLLLGRSGAESAFEAEGEACDRLAGRYAYVLTIDADTRFLPGTVQRMIGTIAHPLNAPTVENGSRRGFAVLQPRMEMMASACVNGFVKLFSGKGGLNAYPVSVSNFWQDMTGEGIFGGKGIYAVRPFMEALEGALPEGRILSHDLIEGTLARAALVGDICFYDGFPSTLGSFMRRLNRWTRGDWQLLPQLFSAKKYPADGKRLSLAARVRLADNLLRSLYAPALLGVLTTAVWLGNLPALIAGLLFAFSAPVLDLPRTDITAWRRAAAELAILPVTAAQTADAAIRTLWRLAFSGRHLLDWVTSADAEGMPGGQALPCRIAAILMLPGLLVPGSAAAAAALAILFAAGPGWILELEQTPTASAAAPGEHASEVFHALAGDIWKFFDRYVNEDSSHLPPDNVQVDPDVGAARRTSPTNIGLYLMSCVAAHELHLITREEQLVRMERTVASVERMEKWKGHLYNWYDVESLRPLTPRYVSAVDSGNCAAALLLCESSVCGAAPGLADRMRSLAESMDFSALYDRERDLFVIGADVEHDRLSESHYDLLASEARILSYTAMMLGAIPVRHWKHLSRRMAAVGRRGVLRSWSGTMFEYLMPELMLHAPENTLLGDAVQGAISAQRWAGRLRSRPWGVSESGYCAFDMHLNYQYRAFGLQELALSGSAADNVAAPYASLMAAPAQPEAVLKNIEHMQAEGWRGEYGFYEAADYRNCDSGGRPRIVKSYMAHHQAMAFCALCNALTGGVLVRDFMKIPQAQALRLLLEEKQAKPDRRKHRAGKPLPAVGRSIMTGYGRSAKPDRRIADAHLLGGAEASALVTADGAVHYWKNEIQATRFGGDLINRIDGACVHLKRERTGEAAVFGSKGVQYEPGKAMLSAELGPLLCTMTVCISPEDGALMKRIEIVNRAESTETVRVADCVPVSLGRSADMMAHAAFRNLFVESKRLAGNAIQLKRRARETGESCPVLLHLVSTPGSVRCETDYEKLIGRMGSTMQPDGICWEMSGTTGPVLNPCTALQSVLTLEGGQKATLHFAMGLTEETEVQRWLQRNQAESAGERAEQLASIQSRAMLGFLGMEPGQYALLQRLSALLADRRLCVREALRGGGERAARSDLWGLGISGELPVLLMHVSRKEDISRVRELIRAHEFYRTLGLKTDLVLLNEYGNDYEQPVRDGLCDAVAFSPLNELRGVPGGVHILDGSALTPAQKEALRRVSAAEFDAEGELSVQMRSALQKLNCSGGSGNPMALGGDRMAALPSENGYGAFLADNRYAIDVFPDRTTPAPWTNLMANDRFGVLMTERGGGFLWADNSRSGRMTAFPNDMLNEGWGWMFYLIDEESGAWLRLLPGRVPMMHWRVLYSPAETVYRFETETVSGEMAFCVHESAPELRVHTTIRSSRDGKYRLVGFVDWLMGTDANDAAFVRTWNRDGACLAEGSAQGVGYFAAANARVQAGGSRNAFLGRGGIQSPDGLSASLERSGGWVLEIPVQIREDRPFSVDWTIGHASERQQAYARIRAFYSRPDYEEIREEAQRAWRRRKEGLEIRTPDEKINRLANGWLLHQTLTARVRARTGLYQPGGAYGFRDQLQDMLALLPTDPARVRQHILRCAARQFEDGDVMHWWHEPFLGVRTRISDDMLFLPYVTAAYVRWTQDAGILDEQVSYLENVEIEPGKEDRFCEMRPGNVTGTLHDHCMRAFRRAAQTGEHGLVLMGAGDWNDGMNRVGVYGLGESVWLTEFLAACAAGYAECAPSEADRAWLIALSDRMSAAVEEHGWDGEWYLRAYMDSGLPIGSASSEMCRIDAISQAWAVLAGLDARRCRLAMDSAWKLLADHNNGIIRLLTPPFGEEGPDPGYIRGYPGGVRENGAQYTHGACWLLLALIHMGDAERAHAALQMLIPENHADTKEKAERYRTEPYVLAADVYDGVHAGRGGWTWYTGSAAWLYNNILALLGFERRGSRVRMNALLGDWPEASVTVKAGNSKYRLVTKYGADAVTLDGRALDDPWIELIDDGAVHEAVYPPRIEEAVEHKAEEKHKLTV